MNEGMSSVVKLPVHFISSKLLVDLCTCSLKHILFIREQISVPFEAFLENEQLSTHRPTIRKIDIFRNLFMQLEEDLNTICSSLGYRI
mmetsp:Transcript_21330/g.39822  ORF Transcript_21330/g.39822 Transcript_21330/m.39822 type:complete len:88 (-) Transcript_21330:780-1043(-)